ncbi:hypothetical protein CFK38_11210 [Brachybacterium vulturis]|uniref:DUF881 domain-containing protein n=1 Tax=Brachybacterium vulturis TaxID=2017484 RepID=A0A291GPX8_9MICO|nr:DUF881 domain-containing protein [Brachybacterium vulturis]ATG52024.1 hypothetical protein CFK38_11210 [Brachybacterium vulturis]
MRDPEHETPHGETPYSPTSLLRALTANPYSVAPLRPQEHPAAEAAPPDNRYTRTITLLLALVLGFAVAVSVLDLRHEAAAEDSPRALLEAEVRQTRTEAEVLEDRRAELEEEIAGAQAAVLEVGDTGAAERLGAFEAAGTGVSLAGPGIVLEIDDSAPLPASPGVSTGTVNRVTDGDLQLSVNGLWAAGAEAIAVNGQRIGPTTAIRTAGSAVLVDFHPLSPPYRITALGDPQQLRTGFEDSAAGEHLKEISSRYGIRRSWEEAEDLAVPARSIGTLREAAVIDEGGEAASETVPTAPQPAPSTAATRGSEEDSP